MTEFESSMVRCSSWICFEVCTDSYRFVAEEEGEKDAQVEENAPQTPAADDGGWGADETPAAAADAGEKPSGGFAAEEETPEEPEEIQKSYDEFLAEKAKEALSFGKKEGRQVNSEDLEGKAFVREGIDDFFSGKVEFSYLCIGRWEY